MTTPSRDRQAEYRRRQRSRGLKQINLWVTETQHAAIGRILEEHSDTPVENQIEALVSQWAMQRDRLLHCGRRWDAELIGGCIESLRALIKNSENNPLSRGAQ